ncbi:Uncharacterized protein conserved in bacteria [Serratia fonticola]|uniref:Uncharacterized protein conserved in bacteria n=1 Tax=Serratia fonticola TaxID=47917 RepID=A0A4V6Z234_SERFO|nr:Uncharacterized protein conserved in bacteria [Serratia fonticola]
MTTLSSIAELNDLTLDLPRFELALEQFAQRLHLELVKFSADHISLRCHQNSTADRWRQGVVAMRIAAFGDDD